MATKACFECGAPATAEHTLVPGATRTLPLCDACYEKANAEVLQIIQLQLEKGREVDDQRFIQSLRDEGYEVDPRLIQWMLDQGWEKG